MKNLLLVSILAAACSDDGGSSQPQEVITTVTLSFTQAGNTVTATFRDADGDGGDPPTLEPINLTAGTWVNLVRFTNELETPAEDITLEVADEAEDHQVFFTTTPAPGSLQFTYSDMDLNGLPIGLTNMVTATVGAGTLLGVTLRHMPPINGNPVKKAGLAAQAQAEGFTNIPGESDVAVNFPVTVQ